jgi:hypothetical protein
MTGQANSRRVRVAFVGSSSVSAGSPLPAALAEELGLGAGEWAAVGRVGSRLAQWFSGVPSDVEPAAIVVLLTGNDDHPRSDQVTAVDAALRRSARTVVWLPPIPYPAGSRCVGRDDRMRTALAQASVARVTSHVRLERSHFGRDLVHLTRAGYRAYATQVGAALRQQLGVRQPAQTVWSSSTIGTLVTGNGARLPMTSTDALWMARALAGEGGGDADAWAITSSMLRRWAMLWDRGQRSFGSITDLIVGRFRSSTPYDGDRGDVELRGYSQPVSVQWRDTGGPRAERRRRIRSLAWDQIESSRRQVVLRLMTGRAPLTARTAVHFAVRSLVESGMRRNADWQIVPVPGASGVFVSTEASRRMREPHVVGADQAPPESSPLSNVRDIVPRVASDVPLPVIVAGAALAAGTIALALTITAGSSS